MINVKVALNLMALLHNQILRSGANRIGYIKKLNRNQFKRDIYRLSFHAPKVAKRDILCVRAE